MVYIKNIRRLVNVILGEQKKWDAEKKTGHAREGEAAMAAVTWKMTTDPPLTFASEREAVVSVVEYL